MGWRTGRMKCLALPQPGWRGCTAGAHAVVNLLDAHAAHPCSCDGLHGTIALMVCAMSQAHASPQQQPPTFCSAPPIKQGRALHTAPEILFLIWTPASAAGRSQSKKGKRLSGETGDNGRRARQVGKICCPLGHSRIFCSSPATWGPDTSSSTRPHRICRVCAHVSHNLYCTPSPTLDGQGLARLHGSMPCPRQEMLRLGGKECRLLGIQLDTPSAAREAAAPASRQRQSPQCRWR